MFHMPQPGFYRGEIIPFLAAQDGWNGDATTWSIQVPIDAVEGDMALVGVISEAQANIATPGGWNEITQVEYSGRRHAWYSRTLQAGDEGQLFTAATPSTVRTVSVTQCVRRHGGNLDVGSIGQGTTQQVNFPFNSRVTDANLYTAVVQFCTAERDLNTYANDVPDGRFKELAPTLTEMTATAGVVFQGTFRSPNSWQLVQANAWNARTFLVW